MMRSIIGATAMTLLLAASTALAQAPAPAPRGQAPPPLRVRGTIEKVDGQTLDGEIARRNRIHRQACRQRAHHRHGQGVARRHQARLLYRRHRHAAARRQPEGHRPSYLHGCAARRGAGALHAVGSRARQHHDQCGRAYHSRRRRRPDHDGEICRRRKEVHRSARYAAFVAFAPGTCRRPETGRADDYNSRAEECRTAR